MKFSLKKATAKITELLTILETAPKEDRIAVTWYELTQIRESFQLKEQTWENGVKLGFIQYMENNHKDEAIFLPKSILEFLNQ